jgi:hypothetical protein
MVQSVVDFELAVRGFSGSYLAEITIDRGADSTSHAGPYELTFDLERLAALMAIPDQYGLALTGMLFARGGMREALAEARGMASAQQTNLRLRLLLGAGAEDLQSLRWELLYLPGREERLCTREDILFSRYLAVGAGALPPAPKTTLRALAAVANPANAVSYGLAPLDINHEKERARTGLAGMEIDWLTAEDGGPCTIDRLISLVPGHEVLFLVCHGKVVKDQGWLFLEGEDGRVARASAQDLAQRLAGTLALPRLTVLVVCESAGSDTGAFLGSLAPRLVEIGIPAVIAMQGALTFPTSNLFLPPLFRELLKDGLIDRAVAVARRSIIGRPDEHAPVLFMSLKSGLLWSAPVSSPAQSSRPVQPSASTSSAGSFDQVKLYQILSGDAFTIEDLEALCFTLNVDWELLRGPVKTTKARSMIQFFQSRGRM